jgi:hypothetical protein
MLGSGRILQRSDVIFVGEGTNAHDILYSGRSSWDLVKQVHALPAERLTVVLKSGESLTGSEVSASDADLTIKRSGRTPNIPKDAVAKIDYLRFKPLSEAHLYNDRELAYLAIFDPKVLQYLLRIDAFMSVRLYDAALPEDDLPLTCPQSSRN